MIVKTAGKTRQTIRCAQILNFTAAAAPTMKAKLEMIRWEEIEKFS